MNQVFYSSYKVRERIDKLSEHAGEICRRLDELKVDNTCSHHQQALKRKKLNSCLRRIQEGLDFYQNMLIEYSAFNNDIIIPFLVYYLSSVEDEAYIAIRDIDGNSIITTENNAKSERRVNRKKRYAPFNSHLTNKKTESYLQDFYAAMDNVPQFSLINDVRDVSDIVKEYRDHKYVVLSGEVNCSLLLGLSYDRGTYPYLKDLIYYLINMKLENHSVEDAERLNAIFQELIIRQQNIR